MPSVDINLEICGESHQQGRQGNINSINDGHIKILLPCHIHNPPSPSTRKLPFEDNKKDTLYGCTTICPVSCNPLVGIIHLLRLYYSGRAFIIEWDCFLLVLSFH